MNDVVYSITRRFTYALKMSRVEEILLSIRVGQDFGVDFLGTIDFRDIVENYNDMLGYEV